MALRRSSMMTGGVGAICLALGGCGEPSTSAGEVANCVSITDGTYFVVEDGRLLPAAAPRAEIIERVVETPIGWPAELEASFGDLGFPWMGLRVREEVATLTGLAPNQDSKERALIAGEQAVRAHPRGGQQVTLFVDGIAVEGGEAGVGADLATLSESNLTLDDCQAAFTNTMQGRNVEFRTGSETIRPDSAQLLDAITGVAILCKDFAIEIGGHTDARGSDDNNMLLSQERAMSVRDYLVERGVPEDILRAVGYGETRPINPASTLEAYRANRRTEFTVTTR